MPLHRLEKRSLSKLTASPLRRVHNSSFGMRNHDPSPLITELVPALSSTHEHGQKKKPLAKWKHLAKGTKSVYEL